MQVWIRNVWHLANPNSECYIKDGMGLATQHSQAGIKMVAGTLADDMFHIKVRQ